VIYFVVCKIVKKIMMTNTILLKKCETRIFQILVDMTTHGRWGGGGLLGCLPLPPQEKVNVTGIPTPESKSKLITCRYRQNTPPKDFS